MGGNVIGPSLVKSWFQIQHNVCKYGKFQACGSLVIGEISVGFSAGQAFFDGKKKLVKQGSTP